MAKKSVPPKAESSPADEAFGAAKTFVEHLGTLAFHARHFRPSPDKPDAWQDLAMTYAWTFIAWHDLTHLLTQAIRAEARRVYLAPSPAIRLGKSKPTPTVIEALADELGVYFRNAVYAGRRHPLEPDIDRVTLEAKTRATARQTSKAKPAEPLGWGVDFAELMKQETPAAVRKRLGIKTLEDGWMLMANEWKLQDRERGESALYLLRCEPIDFADLKAQLIREAERVLAPTAVTPAETKAPLIVAVGNQEVTAHNIELARIKTAYIEAGGKVQKAMDRLANDPDHPLRIPQSTFYHRLEQIDKRDGMRWRSAVDGFQEPWKSKKS